MKQYLVIICMFLGAVSATATTADSLKNTRASEPAVSLKVQADSAYAHEEYEKAIQLYLKVAAKGQHPTMCYNLGNCYYRIDDMAHAVLWYERAYLLSPGDADIRFNLDMARSKTIDKVVPQHEIFFISWYHWLVNLMSVDAWAWLSLALFVLCLLALATYIFADVVWIRKCGLSLFVVLLIACVLGNVCANSQRQRFENRTSAIVMVPAATVKSTPSQSGNDLFVIHEGTRVEIRDNSLNDWLEVELADGKVGWITRKQIEVI